MDPLDTSAAPVYRFDIHVGATHTRNAWLLLLKAQIPVQFLALFKLRF